jgi:hypothetical protein
VFQTFGLLASRTSIRRVLRRAQLTWKKVKKLLGKAKPETRAAHVEELLKLFAGVCDGEVLLVYADEVHIHRDLELGYTWGRKGQRLWRASDCPKRSDRMNAYLLPGLRSGGLRRRPRPGHRRLRHPRGLPDGLSARCPAFLREGRGGVA